jgi:winged helix DNA-binding protein
MTPDRLLASRLASQWLSVAGPADPAAAVAHLGAVQAQDYRQSLWALGLRAAGSAVATVEAAIAAGTILRTWPMRGTIHFVPAQDARWMVELLAGRRVRQAAGRYARIGLTEAVFGQAADIIAGALSGGRRARRTDLYALLTRHGVDCSASAHGSRGYHILSYLSMTGLLCLGPLDGRQPTVALLDEWAPRPRTPASPLAELATRYFTSHGPATDRDFAWWSGLPLRGAREAVAQAGPALGSGQAGGQTFWHGAAQPPARQPPEGAYLLPAYDEYTVAYRDRSALLAGPDLPHSVVLNPVMVLDGRAAGVWKQATGKQRVMIELAPFRTLSAGDRERLRQAAERYAAFAGLPADIRYTTPDTRRH